MIDVTSLTRFYGKAKAVDNVSFSIGKREIVGLLGHNGAGKTTVMKMLSGYLEPSAGDIRIGGLNLETDRRRIQQKLGYLPENLPVYPEMTIAEYLDYAAALKGLRGEPARRTIRHSIEATELGERLFDTIGTLSRGFKQRVGVAQAILGEPELLILDEPGNGLDPQQNEHMRALIREVAGHATVILSTHIMQEVDALCDRVLVLSNGALALDERLAALRSSRRLILRASNDGELGQLLQAMPQVREVTVQKAAAGQQLFLLTLHEGTNSDTAAGDLSRAVVEHGARLLALAPEQRDLEQVFREAVQAVEVPHAA